jgi:hypothetical protein
LDTGLDWFCRLLDLEIYPVNWSNGLFYRRHAEPFPGHVAPGDCRICTFILARFFGLTTNCAGVRGKFAIIVMLSGRAEVCVM